jgi:hypothetical protein
MQSMTQEESSLRHHTYIDTRVLKGIQTAFVEVDISI